MLQGNSIHLNILGLFKLLENASGLLQLQHGKHDVILLIQSGVITDMRLNNKILSRDIAISFLIPWMTRPEVYFSFIALPHHTEVRRGIKLSGVPLLLELLRDLPDEGIFERLPLESPQHKFHSKLYKVIPKRNVGLAKTQTKLNFQR